MLNSFSASAQMPSHILEEHFHGNGAINKGGTIYQSREAWFAHATAILRALNLDCPLVEETARGYKFHFCNLRDLCVFDFAASGEGPGDFKFTQVFDDPDFMPYWKRAAIGFMSDKGIQFRLTEGQDRLIFSFGLRSDYTSFRIAYCDQVFEKSAQEMLLRHRSSDNPNPSPL